MGWAYEVVQVAPHGAIELLNRTVGTKFKVNGQRVKPYVEGFKEKLEKEVDLEECLLNNTDEYCT